MQLLIAAIGRWKASPERALFDEYAARLKPVGWSLTLKEIVASPAASVTEQRSREMRALLEATVEFRRERLVFLDETGKDLSSPQLAAQFGRWRDAGDRRIAFLIGGDTGLEKDRLREADLTLCLGRLTWPHLLVRTLLAEQLYRAQSILAGHPYHRV